MDCIDDLIRTEPSLFVERGNTSVDGDWYIKIRLPDGYPRVQDPILYRLREIQKAYEEEKRSYREQYVSPLNLELSALKEQLDILVPESTCEKDREFEKRLIEVDQSCDLNELLGPLELSIARWKALNPPKGDKKRLGRPPIYEVPANVRRRKSWKDQQRREQSNRTPSPPPAEITELIEKSTLKEDRDKTQQS